MTAALLDALGGFTDCVTECTPQEGGFSVTMPHTARPRYNLAVLRVRLLGAGHSVQDRTLHPEPSILVFPAGAALEVSR